MSSSQSSRLEPTVTPRREFLGQLATAAVALAGTACAAPAIAASQTAPTVSPAATPPAPTKTVFDDSWTQRLTGKHKAVFDSPEIFGGAAIYQAELWASGFKEMYQVSDADAQAVLVLRHAAVPMVFNDAIWSKYQIGKRRKVKDDNGALAKTNPYVESLARARERGSIILGCNLAAMGIAASIARDTNQDTEAVRQEIRSNLIPGALLMPSGIFAVHRAQEAGCTYMRAG